MGERPNVDIRFLKSYKKCYMSVGVGEILLANLIEDNERICYQN